MRIFALRLVFALAIIAITNSISFAQVNTNTSVLRQSAIVQAEKEKKSFDALQSLAREKGWEMLKKDKKGRVSILVGVDGFGMPQYLSTESNIVAAATIGTNKLWDGGVTGLNLSGSSNNMKDKLGVWDGGKVRNTHIELNGRILQKDAAATFDDHATHVSGTLIASGVNPLAKGMSYGLQRLIAYDFNNHLSEMLTESPNLLVSNHSYGSIAGWRYNDAQTRWEFNGTTGSTEDYKFGYYSSETQVWDSIAYNAPYYLIVKSSGNNRDENGPAVGQPYWRYDASNVMINAGNRPAGISSNDGYDIISTYGTAKNVLTVGAIKPITTGYTKPADVAISTFSSWGPTDDGRIKPDVVADGVGLLSSISTSDNAYDTYSGTSMATPSAAGSLLLLQEYYSKLHAGAFMRSATLKGLIIHTADEAGANPGPDYQYGWGLINMEKAAAVITANNTGHLIQEGVLNNGGTFSLPVIASGNGTISATLSWTDPKASVEPTATALNNTTKKLVDDLNIVIKKGSVVYRPWVLSPSVPNAAATKGINTLDNVEKVELTDVIPGETYTIEITHAGTLERGSQAYSLIVSGAGSQAYCASAATNTAGAKIDSVAFSNIKNKNAAGCTSYSNFTTLTGNVEPGQTIPLFIRLNSCDATTAGKIVKVFIDANNDGDFTDAGETLATSGVISGNGAGTGDYNPNITIPATLVTGKYTRLRIVMLETSNAADVNACGTYTKGETQDYNVFVGTASSDVGVVELLSPQQADCSSTTQYVTVRIRNFGSTAKNNIPVSVVVKQGAATIATLTSTFTNSIDAGTDGIYTFQTPVTLAAATTYTFTSTTSLVGDQSAANNQLISTVTTSANAASPAGTAAICNTSATLTVTSPSSSDIYTWYNSASATTPIASGVLAFTNTIASTYYLGKNEITKNVGPTDKLAFTSGGYNIFSDNQLRLIFTTLTPLTIERARLYIGQSGKIKFTLRKITNMNYLTGAYSYYPSYDRSYSVDAYATAPTTPVPGTSNNDPADAGAIFYLGMSIPDPGEYAIFIESEGASIFRNNGITTTNYPYSIANVISFTGNGATNNADVNYNQQFYYFFYDVAVKLNSCASARTAIVPTTQAAPVITASGNVLTSSAATGNQWYLNGSIIAGATSNSYTATTSGLYTVQASNGTCVLTSNEINFVATAIPNIDPSEIGLVVSPNPASGGQFTVKLETRTRANLSIELINTTGQKVYNFNSPNFTGKLTRLITPGKIAAGVYYLQVLHDKKRYIQKIVVN